MIDIKQLYKKVAVLGCIMGSVLLVSCSTTSTTIAPDVIDHTGAYIVQPGDTLYSVAWQFGLDYREIIANNQLKPPYTLYKGERLELARSRGTAPAGLGNPPVIISHLPDDYLAANNAKSQVAPAPVNTVAKTTPVAITNPAWLWPTQGSVMKKFSLSSTPVNKGIDIAGKISQPVIASAKGEVVYSGNGIPGYGNLIIIKHNAAYLTAYAYNQKNLVHEGQTVSAGQKIATMGSGSSKQPELHFEMRYNGNPVDPLNYLPAHK